MAPIKIKITQKIFQTIRKLRSVHYFFVLIPVLFLIATGLRFDHRKLERLKAAVKTADAKEDKAALAKSISELHRFAATHTLINLSEENGRTIISFGTGPVYLEQQYLKNASTELEKIKKRQPAQGKERNIYAEASAVCQPQAIRNRWAWNSKPYIDCMMGELAKHPSSPAVSDFFKATLPSSNLYRLNYASPLWAPSFVGYLMVVAVVLILIILIRVVYASVLYIFLLSLRKKPKETKKPS